MRICICAVTDISKYCRRNNITAMEYSQPCSMIAIPEDGRIKKDFWCQSFEAIPPSVKISLHMVQNTDYIILYLCQMIKPQYGVSLCFPSFCLLLSSAFISFHPALAGWKVILLYWPSRFKGLDLSLRITHPPCHFKQKQGTWHSCNHPCFLGGGWGWGVWRCQQSCVNDRLKCS